MDDVFGRWLLQGGEAVVSGTRSIRTHHGNKVQAYIEGRDYYQALAAEIADTQGGRGHFVLISGWGFDQKTPLDPRVANQASMGDLLGIKSQRGVAIRALIWAHPDNSNRATVKWFGDLDGGGAIHDDRVLFAGSHHQKFAVVSNSGGLVAFCGGMDIASNRLKDGEFGRPWHDVQLRIVGDAAVDLWQTFYDRWIEQASLAVGRNGLARPLYPIRPAPQGADKSVQILHTYANGSRHQGLDTNKNREDIRAKGLFRRQSLVYQFAPAGERSIYRLLIKAIRATRVSIYVEDQYLVGSGKIEREPEFGWELAKCTSRPSFKGMVILTNGVGTIQGELFQTNYRRRSLWDQSTVLNSDKISVWAYKGGPTSAYWMHAKAWIFDDTLALIGSANCNRRGYSHDSEIAAAVLDVYSTESLPFAHDLRMRLWMKHLNSRKTRVTANDVVDFVAGIKHWVDSDDTDLMSLNLSIADRSQPDRSILDPSPIEQSRESWKRFFQLVRDELGMFQRKDWRDFEWDSIIDPDGS